MISMCESDKPILVHFEQVTTKVCVCVCALQSFYFIRKCCSKPNRLFF